MLKQLEADRVPQIRVYNKIDKLDRPPRVTNNRDGEGRAVWLSAATGEGVSMLCNAIGERLLQKTLHGVIHLEPSQGRPRARLFELGAVLTERVQEDGGWELEIRMAEADLKRFLKRENLPADVLRPLQGSEDEPTSASAG